MEEVGQDRALGVPGCPDELDRTVERERRRDGEVRRKAGLDPDDGDEGQCPFQFPRQHGRQGQAQRHTDQRGDGDGQDQRARGGRRPGHEQHAVAGGDEQREGLKEHQPAEDQFGRTVTGQEQALIDPPGGQGEKERPAGDRPGDSDDGDVEVPGVLALPDVLAGHGQVEQRGERSEHNQRQVAPQQVAALRRGDGQHPPPASHRGPPSGGRCGGGSSTTWSTLVSSASMWVTTTTTRPACRQASTRSQKFT